MSTDMVKYAADQALSSSELIARWDFVSSNLDERSTLSKLCGECIALFRQLMVSATVKDRVAPLTLRNLDRSRCTLILWADAYRVPDGGLDDATEESRYLRRKVLHILSSIAATLCERLLPKLRVLDSFSIDQLQGWRQEALTAVQQDYRDREAHDSSSDSDGSESDVSVSNELEDIVESLETDTQLLMELDRFIQAPSVLIPKLQEPTEQEIIPWRPQDAFAQIIRTRFPDALEKLVDALAKANLTRMQRCAEIREKHADMVEQEEAVAIEPRNKPATTIGGQTQDDSGYGTLVAASAHGDSVNALSKYAETVMSYAAGDRTVKIPPLPPGAKEGKPFDCLACGKSVSFTRGRMWKRHLFSDLQPWTCIEPDCVAENKTFTTQETWLQHLEFDHEYGPDWTSRPCPLCQEDTGHGAASCSKHLATHLEEISLATLPRPTEEDDVSQLSISSGSKHSDVVSMRRERSRSSDLADDLDNAGAVDEKPWSDDSSYGSVEGGPSTSLAELEQERLANAIAFACDYPSCSKSFNTSGQLKKHLRYHENHHMCKYEGCGKLFHNERDCRRHMAAHHGAPMPKLYCVIARCKHSLPGGKAFSRKDSWVRHMRTVHNKKHYEMPDPTFEEPHWKLKETDSGDAEASSSDDEIGSGINEELEDQQASALERNGRRATQNAEAPPACFARVVNRFESSSETGLTVNEGDLLAVFSTITAEYEVADWWYCGTTDGKLGFLPTHCFDQMRPLTSHTVRLAEISVAIANTAKLWGDLLKIFAAQIGPGPDQMPLESFLLELRAKFAWRGNYVSSRPSQTHGALEPSTRASRSPSISPKTHGQGSVGDKVYPFVEFTDAIGRKFMLPFDTCKTWKDMEAIILRLSPQMDDFDHLVKQGCYSLSDPDGEIILPSAWEKVIRPGSEVSMEMRPPEGQGELGLMTLEAEMTPCDQCKSSKTTCIEEKGHVSCSRCERLSKECSFTSKRSSEVIRSESALRAHLEKQEIDDYRRLLMLRERRARMERLIEAQQSKTDDSAVPIPLLLPRAYLTSLHPATPSMTLSEDGTKTLLESRDGNEGYNSSFHTNDAMFSNTGSGGIQSTAPMSHTDFGQQNFVASPEPGYQAHRSNKHNGFEPLAQPLPDSPELNAREMEASGIKSGFYPIASGGDGGTPATCTNCFTQSTPLWRRNPEGQPLCNACGLYLMLHDKIRPLNTKADASNKRNRGSGVNLLVKGTSIRSEQNKPVSSATPREDSTRLMERLDEMRSPPMERLEDSIRLMEGMRAHRMKVNAKNAIAGGSFDQAWGEHQTQVHYDPQPPIAPDDDIYEQQGFGFASAADLHANSMKKKLNQIRRSPNHTAGNANDERRDDSGGYPQSALSQAPPAALRAPEPRKTSSIMSLLSDDPPPAPKGVQQADLDPVDSEGVPDVYLSGDG